MRTHHYYVPQRRRTFPFPRARTQDILHTAYSIIVNGKTISRLCAVGGRPHTMPATHITCKLTAARFAKVQPHQLHHVRLQQVDVPPRHALRLRQRARFRCVERRRRAIDRLLRNAARIGGALHWRLAGGHVQHCNIMWKTELLISLAQRISLSLEYNEANGFSISSPADRPIDRLSRRRENIAPITTTGTINPHALRAVIEHFCRFACV